MGNLAPLVCLISSKRGSSFSGTTPITLVPPGGLLRKSITLRQGGQFFSEKNRIRFNSVSAEDICSNCLMGKFIVMGVTFSRYIKLLKKRIITTARVNQNFFIARQSICISYTDMLPHYWKLNINKGGLCLLDNTAG